MLQNTRFWYTQHHPTLGKAKSGSLANLWSRWRGVSIRIICHVQRPNFTCIPPICTAQKKTWKHSDPYRRPSRCARREGRQQTGGSSSSGSFGSAWSDVCSRIPLCCDSTKAPALLRDGLHRTTSYSKCTLRMYETFFGHTNNILFQVVGVGKNCRNSGPKFHVSCLAHLN